MSQIKLQSMPATQLVERFVQIALEQDKAELMGDTQKFRPLFSQMEAVEAELKSRPGDQRQALLALYTHQNAQVRLNAIKATLAVAPIEARLALEKLAASREYPQSGDAGMSIWTLDQGIFKPT